MKKSLLFLFMGLSSLQGILAQESELSVEKIMQDPKWMGTFPSDITWGIHSENIYFDYNPEGNPEDSLYRININRPDLIEEVKWQDQEKLVPQRGDFNESREKKVYVRDGALFVYDLEEKKVKKLLELDASIEDPVFLLDEDQIGFVMENNAYVYHSDGGTLDKITNIYPGAGPQEDKELSEQDQWLREENLDLLREVREREESKKASEEYRELTSPKPYKFYAGDKQIRNVRLSPDARFVSFHLIEEHEDKRTDVPDYTDASGYTVDLPARSKVGRKADRATLAIYDVQQDTVVYVNTSDLPGIKDLPDYIKDYPEKKWSKKVRSVVTTGPFFSEDGKKAIVNVRSSDNKDRWIALLNPETGELKSLDRQRDEAWIGGPGIGYSWYAGSLGWLPDDETIWFQSEDSGYSHLYTLNIDTGQKKQLTSGEFEVFDPFLSKDKEHWFLTTSAEHPGERHFYKMPLKGGKMTRLTSLTGNNEVYLSPDEKKMAIRYSYMNEPWELYLKKTSADAELRQLTSGQSEAFSSYDWKEPELIKFRAEDGTMVPARLYQPSEEDKNGAAVIFVHGAGYLQNAHKWWSSYFREYMFHNLLADLGYTVLDIDYRGSAGYGRDWRTAIYRHMGGKDLSDQVDGAEYLVEEQGIEPDRIGIYGGSYGGFITLMAMFTQPEVFESGAALRSVTDWAHYNHGYTSNILNTPAKDPIAYRRSSPIYFAEGLQGNLLIAHGMTDTNVHFQDVVRLAQRLIELEKENWELAVYPVEGHGFVEPSSWTDEYRRILKLFNETLLPE